MRIRDLFDQAKLKNQCLFIPFIMGGDPNLQTTEELIHGLATIGADIIEIGVPFSDPVADGKINQRAAMRALKNNVSLTDCCDLVKKIRRSGCSTPIVLFSYFNPILRLGLDNFAKLVRDSEIDAVLVVDLPLEESMDLTDVLKQYQIGSIAIIAPTTSPERIKISSQYATEFLYYVSRTGVTGTQSDLSSTLEMELNQVKQHTHLPIAVGFGISTPKQAAAVAKFADGVIVGSALVEKLETTDIHEGKTALFHLATELNAMIK